MERYLIMSSLQVGVIHPYTDVEAVVRHAYDNALFMCEQCYLTGPPLEVKVANATDPSAKVTVTQVDWYKIFQFPFF